MTKKLSLILNPLFLTALSLVLGLFVLQYNIAKAFTVISSEVLALDPGFTLDPLNTDKQWGLVAAGFPQAWEKTTGSTSTIVAIIDTGIDQTHEDLSGVNFVTGFDFVNSTLIRAGQNSDDNGHGTLVAGIIGASPNNGKGITGTNWKITLMPIKALDKEGRGDTSTISKAIIWASDNGASIINLSLGGSGFEHDADLASAISYAYNRGAVIIAAAGNDSSKGVKDLDENPVFPVCNNNNHNMVIGVTAVDQNFVKPEFANYGKNCIDVSAPGRRILSSINIDPVTQSGTQIGYAYVSGTSLATAFVSGQAALIKSLYPFATSGQIRDRIIATSKKIDSMNLAQCGGRSCQDKLGSGFIDVPASLATDIPLLDALEGDVIKAQGQTRVYLISGGQKRPISPFVFNQRFINSLIKVLPQDRVDRIPLGPYVMPPEGSLVKALNDSTVYYISSGFKLPVTSQIFKQRKLKFSDIQEVDSVEVETWVTGKFLAPSDGTLVKKAGSKTLYWAIGGVLHPINAAFYKDRGLWIFPVLTVTQKDFMSYNIGEAYLR